MRLRKPFVTKEAVCRSRTRIIATITHVKDLRIESGPKMILISCPQEAHRSCGHLRDLSLFALKHRATSLQGPHWAI